MHAHLGARTQSSAQLTPTNNNTHTRTHQNITECPLIGMQAYLLIKSRHIIVKMLCSLALINHEILHLDFGIRTYASIYVCM